MRLHYIQHVPFEGIGAFETWTRKHGHSLTRTRLFAGEILPSLAAFDWLVILGGPMSVHDDNKHPWLDLEKQFLRRAIDRGRPVIGVCLGAQLIADALGATVSPQPVKEIGWYPVQKESDCDLLDGVASAMLPLHWHGEAFTLPAGAIRLFSSEACAQQGFLYGDRILGLQFHLEMQQPWLRALIARSAGDLKPGPFVQAASVMLADAERFERANAILHGILDKLASRAWTDYSAR
ncbi:MAG: type 1 glutamine amidotransferase [Verrucomicrobia bacterium]|nr:type 1 glutamine amidotransferase [Verrucomicrobiota bacterium]